MSQVKSPTATVKQTESTRRDSGICSSVMEAIGETPLIRINQLAKDLDCEVLVKAEFFNAGGSVKDRIGRRMVEDAEAKGIIKPGDTLIEPTSGNTGIGLAMAAATKGYRCIIVLPEKMSKEKVDVLKALGAEIMRTPTEAAYDAPDSHISVAKRLHEEIPNSHILDQYSNLSNPLAHYEGTAEELLRQTGGKIDMLVAGAGTGGTISGIAKRLKEHNPNIQVIGVDPVGSILAEPETLNDNKRLEPYLVEGIGYDFIPNVCDRSLVDEWMKSNDKDSLVQMRALIRHEGLLCGGSSGAAVSCALKAAKRLKKGQRCVVILPDSVRNYMSKALSDDWMIDHGFVDNKIIQTKQYSAWWSTKRLCDVPSVTNNTPLTITSDVSCCDAIAVLKEGGYDMVPVIEDNEILGVVTEGNITNRLLSGRLSSPDTTSVKEAGIIFKSFHEFNMQDQLATVAQVLDHCPFALVTQEQRVVHAAREGEHRVDGPNKRRKLSDEISPAESQDESTVTTAESPTNPSSVGGSKAKLSASCSHHVVKRKVVSAIVTRIDLLEYIAAGEIPVQGRAHQN
ncbi:Cystathionine beta-synthase [Seminavis robusta]|uniref:Cystathionine beta-synthase n=1 Tax=Seminavis robusta TaxID=568900 RepID=A0A9N8HGI3_9STRA|nr:Cystathionine beta-synthase [Seminavis robusta]|eukprot:Sro637_g179390.1 Cystathionine beta-synthase (567) ;mRNA; r:13462-15810